MDGTLIPGLGIGAEFPGEGANVPTAWGGVGVGTGTVLLRDKVTESKHGWGGAFVQEGYGR